MSPQVHVAMLGARQHYAVPRLLNRSGMLGRLYTELYAGNQTDGEIPACKVTSFNLFGLWYRWNSRRAAANRQLEALYIRGASAFARRVIRHGLRGADLLFSYNGPALELFEHAKQQGIPCVLEQIHVPQTVARTLLREEVNRWPDWELGLNLQENFSPMEEREGGEWRLADCIVGGSPFALRGIDQQEGLRPKCRVVPYGVPLDLFSPGAEKAPPHRTRLKVLFAGGVSLRKGAPYLLEALRLLDSAGIEARFAGQVQLHPDKIHPYRSFASFLGPVSQGQMRQLYRWADLLVAPSICEGSALVTYEALACGVPVIATPNAGSWIQDGQEGLLVPIRDAPALAAALERFVQDSEFLRFCKRNAALGRKRIGLEAYRQRLVQVVQETLS
ncbi:MAG: glycosyltransferase family 4 protein [Candidatus Omnitrophica bacterium]|nr:glycosyltransferase family 4 protein [Candidatus Omnitrophota bacterium]